MNNPDPVSIVYMLYHDADLDRHLLQAVIVDHTPSGTIGYWKQLATAETLGYYDGLGREEYHQSLLRTTTELDKSWLYDKYKPRGRKKHTWQDILEQPERKTQINAWIDRRLNYALKLLTKHVLALATDFGRHKLANEHLVSVIPIVAQPLLRLSRSAQGVDYQLQLQINDQIITPMNANLTLLTNNPGWFIINNMLCELPSINSNKLKPFLRKQTIHIKPELVISYFEKFVIDVANKAEIEAEGFEIRSSSVLDQRVLIPTYDISSGKYVLSCNFKYDDVAFNYGDTQQSRKKLKIVGQEVAIHITKRDTQIEDSYVLELTNKGLNLSPSRRLYLDDDDPLGIYFWMQEHRAYLVSSGWSVPQPKMEGRLLTLEEQHLEVGHSISGDWFDIYGTVVVGSFTIPFVELIPYIQQENRFFILPDETIFILPLAWLATYAGLARHGEIADGKIRLRKSQQGLLQEAQLAEQSGQAVLSVDPESIPYEPSTRLKATLRDYQLTGIKWLVQRCVQGLGACLADDMGLGKTLQTLALLLYLKEQKPENEEAEDPSGQMSLFGGHPKIKNQALQGLILAPASLVFNWTDEIKKFAPHLVVCQYVGVRRSEIRSSLPTYDIVLTTYETAMRDIDYLNTIEWSCVVLDESQKIKNHNSKIFAAVNTLAAASRITLTGTPIENSLKDLWSQMQFLNPDILGAFSFFKREFLVPIQKDHSELALKELKALIEPFILRRTKSEVAKDLPPLTQQIRYCEMSSDQKDYYDEEKSAARNYLLSNDTKDPKVRFHVFRSLLRLRQIANHPSLIEKDSQISSSKFREIRDVIATLARSGHKTLIFSSFTKHLDLVAQHLKKEELDYLTLTGKTSQKKRASSVRAFQESPDHLFFLISIKAGGVGLNLTKASYVLLLDPWWNPFIEEQAIARAHRMGQHNPVHVIRFICKDSIEEKIKALQEKKMALFTELLSYEAEPKLGMQEMKELLDT